MSNAFTPVDGRPKECGEDRADNVGVGRSHECVSNLTEDVVFAEKGRLETGGDAHEMDRCRSALTPVGEGLEGLEGNAGE